MFWTVLLTTWMNGDLKFKVPEEPPFRITGAALASIRGEQESVESVPSAKLIILPSGESSAAAPKTGAKYSEACSLYMQEGAELYRRFEIHFPDREALPLAKRVARFYALLWRASELRLGRATPLLRRETVHVWLSRTGEPGGEQTGAHIYLYDIGTARKNSEWLRELAHEYGHYLLPGASGYAEPENWSNGILGERLFLQWLRDDLKSVTPNPIPFGEWKDIADYCDRQSDPLLARSRKSRPDPARLAGRSSDSMDDFCALMLHIASLHGSRTLFEMLDNLPENRAAGARAAEFLDAFTAWATQQETLLLSSQCRISDQVYLPAGAFILAGRNAKVTAITIDNVKLNSVPEGFQYNNKAAGWHSILIDSSDAAIQIEVRRK